MIFGICFLRLQKRERKQMKQIGQNCDFELRGGCDGIYSFPIAAIAKYFTFRSLTQKKRIPSQFWRAEVCNQGISRATLSLEALGENLSSPPPAPGSSLFPWLVSAPPQSLPPRSRGLLPCVPVSCTSVSYKNTCHLI